MQTGFPEVKKKLGFGAMRLPMIGEKVDLAAFSKMVDLFLSEGFNYFDTAHPYLNGESELALREALTSRYRGKPTFLPISSRPLILIKNQISGLFLKNSFNGAASVILTFT